MVVQIGWKFGGMQTAFHSRLKLRRERGDDHQVARILAALSDINRVIGLPKEGIQQAEEASDIFQQSSDTVNQAGALINLAYALH
jgi:hypothetical protein